MLQHSWVSWVRVIFKICHNHLSPYLIHFKKHSLIYNYYGLLKANEIKHNMEKVSLSRRIIIRKQTSVNLMLWKVFSVALQVICHICDVIICFSLWNNYEFQVNAFSDSGLSVRSKDRLKRRKLYLKCQKNAQISP